MTPQAYLICDQIGYICGVQVGFRYAFHVMT